MNNPIEELWSDSLVEKISKICLEEINENNYGVLKGFDFDDFHFKFSNWRLDIEDEHIARTIFAFMSETRAFAEIEIYDWLKFDIKFFVRKYSEFIDKDVVYYDEKGNALNNPDAKQEEFNYQLKEFVTRFYQYFFAELRFRFIRNETKKNLKTQKDETKEISTENINETELSNPAKIKWLGTPAHLALIIDLLIEKGYIQQPSKYAERSAAFLLNHFEIDGYKTSKEGLARLLHKDEVPIKNPTHTALFYKMPHRNNLDK